MSDRWYTRIALSVLVLWLLVLASGSAFPNIALAQAGEGIVHSVRVAPVVPDGDVAGHVTDFVINFDISMDPEVAGRGLAQGKTIKVTLPDAFVNDESLPLAGVGTHEDCVPGNLRCNTAVLLQGWPQHPVPPPKYELSYEGTNTIVFTALEDIVSNPPAEPGIKQSHLILNSFTNPGPGIYQIQVAAETGPGGTVEQGVGTLEILPDVPPRISIVSAFNEGTPNTLYQTAEPGQQTPLPYDLLLWDTGGEPLPDVTISDMIGDRAELVQGDRIVGEVTVETPADATGHRVFTEEPSSAINAPVTGVPTVRLRAFFETGSAPGDYTVIFSLAGGNSAQAFVTVAGQPATMPETGSHQGSLWWLWLTLIGLTYLLAGSWLLRRSSARV